MNRATRTIVATVGIMLAIAGLVHGFFETLQGSHPTSGLVIKAIGPEMKPVCPMGDWGLRSDSEKTKDLTFLKDLVEAGKIRSITYRRCNFFQQRCVSETGLVCLI